VGEPPAERPPRVVLVTDRRRLTAALGLPESDWGRLLTEQIRGAIQGGVDLIQVRERDLPARTLLQFLQSLFQDVPQSASRVLVNDRLDLALATGARGVHLREHSLQTAAVRRLATSSSFVVGRSVHDEAGARQNLTASYLLAGTVKPSHSKPGRGLTLGWEGLARIVAAAGAVPVVAIGGLGTADVGRVVAQGAAGLAAIGAFIPERAEPLANFVQRRAEEMHLEFDSHTHVT
jgi:thiamine-phosphate pyrophosphorylase